MTAVSGSVTVGIDIETTAVKAVAVDDSGEVLARSRIPHKLISPAPDLLEHDASRAWRRGPLQALAAVRSPGDQLDGVCVCSMVPSLTAVDRRGRPQVPGLLYGDGRGRGNRFAASSPDEPGTLSTSDVLPDSEGFLRWAVAEAPGAHGYWPAQAVANFALSGVAAIDSGVAMMSASLLSAGQWDVAKLGKIGVNAAQMPLIVNMGARAGTVTGTDAALAGGTVDAMCDQIVSGADNTGDVLVICGATLIVWAVVDDWIDVPGLWTVPHTVAGKVLVGGPSNAGALFVDWARSLLHGSRRLPTSRRANRLGAVTEDPGQAPRRGHPDRVPVWTPYLRGERVPYNDTSLRSSLQGLDITHDADALERAAYESTGFVVRHMLDLGQIKARRIVASGGGTRVTPWMQAMADASGLPVDVVKVHEGSALGAAFLARMAAGLEESLDDARRWARVGYRVEPDAAWQEAADERYVRYRALGPGN
ncbi:MAG TPA: FGGY-family carbohydrate kinase [Acidimicrobiales bacterium]